MTASFSPMKGCIFDLDGVIVDTTKYHFQAWQRMAMQLGFDFTEEQHQHLRGISRMESLEKLLEWGGMYVSEAEKLHWADVKNNWYIELIAHMKPSEVLPGVLPFLQELKTAGLGVALVSSSKNARSVLKSTQLEPYFDAVIDGNIIKKNKPHPERFLLAADALGLLPASTLVFEDAYFGVKAALRGGFLTVGVGHFEDLNDAHLIIPSFENLSFASLLARLPERVL